MNAAGIQRWIEATHAGGPTHTARWMAIAVDISATFLQWISSIEEARTEGTLEAEERAEIFYEAMMEKCTMLLDTEQISPDGAAAFQEHVKMLIERDNKITEKKLTTIKFVQDYQPENN